MALTPSVGTGQIITPTWGNEIRDRTVQPFASKAELDAAWASAPTGAHAYTLDTFRYYTKRAAGWQMDWNAGLATANTDANGDMVIAHSLGRVATVAVGNLGQTGSILLVFRVADATNVTFRLYTSSTGTGFANQVGIKASWWAT